MKLRFSQAIRSKSSLKLQNLTNIHKIPSQERHGIPHIQTKRITKLHSAKNMHYSINPEEIKSETEKLGYRVTNIWNITNIELSFLSPCFFVEYSCSTNILWQIIETSHRLLSAVRYSHLVANSLNKLIRAFCVAYIQGFSLFICMRTYIIWSHTRNRLQAPQIQHTLTLLHNSLLDITLVGRYLPNFGSTKVHYYGFIGKNLIYINSLNSTIEIPSCNTGTLPKINNISGNK
jgi:hypothetical protein